jgi:RHS repeat-associated protein
VLEETYNSSTGKTTLSAVNVYGADGWRVRDYPGPTVAATDDVFYAFSFDPQGNVVSKMDSDNTANPGYDLASYEGYGHRAADILAGTGQSPAPHQDPARFGGEYGYYTDYSTGLLCLTHRYYDPGTGRFVTRDPSGYGGGVNLYGFAGDNPVNEMDPDGTDGFPDFGGLIPLSIPKDVIAAGLGVLGSEINRNILRPAQQAFDESAEAQGPVIPEAPQGVDPVASPEEQAEEEEDQSVHPILPGTMQSRGLYGRYTRPNGFRKGMRNKVWQNATDADGRVFDPVTGDEIPQGSTSWHMGHKPGYEFWKHRLSATKRGISRKDFLTEHNDPSHFRPELPDSNSGHSGEAPVHIYRGP